MFARAGPILILAPVDGDAEAMGQVLRGGGFRTRPCVDVGAFGESFNVDSGALIITEEALTDPDEAEQLGGALAGQPAWSDLPVILLAAPRTSEDTAWELARGLESVGNVTILERPLRRSTLLNAVGVALRARARQHELRAHKEHLEGLVIERTSELAESMRQLQTRERLAALGTLAAGLGHDIANLVLPIRMRLAPLAAECRSDRAREDIDAIGTALGYLTNLSVGLRLMALDPTRDAASAGIDDLSRWWSQVRGVMRGVLPRHVRLEGELQPGFGVRMSAHQLTQAVFNLVQNAGEAMAEREDGVVRVSAEHVRPRAGGGVVQLCVCDNGPGMSRVVLARCFEPYFSTKGRAIATGMGLAMVRGVAENAGGAVHVRSELGRGTTFTLTLPAADARGIGGAERPGEGASRVAALSVPRGRAGAIAASCLENLRVSVVRPEGSEAPGGSLWVAQDPPWDRVGDFLSRRPGGRVVVLRSEGAERGGRDHGEDLSVAENITVLPLSAPASVLRAALTKAVRGTNWS